VQLGTHSATAANGLGVASSPELASKRGNEARQPSGLATPPSRLRKHLVQIPTRAREQCRASQPSMKMGLSAFRKSLHDRVPLAMLPGAPRCTFTAIAAAWSSHCFTQGPTHGNLIDARSDVRLRFTMTIYSPSMCSWSKVPTRRGSSAGRWKTPCTYTGRWQGAQRPKTGALERALLRAPPMKGIGSPPVQGGSADDPLRSACMDCNRGHRTRSSRSRPP